MRVDQRNHVFGPELPPGWLRGGQRDEIVLVMTAQGHAGLLDTARVVTHGISKFSELQKITKLFSHAIYSLDGLRKLTPPQN